MQQKSAAIIFSTSFALALASTGSISIGSCLAEDVSAPIASDKVGTKAEAYFQKGHEALDAKHVGAAEKYYRKAIELEPNEPRFHRQLALLLLRERRLPEAERESRIDIADDPTDWRGFIVLGKILHLQRRYDEECELYKKTLAILPPDQTQLKTQMQNFIKTDTAAAKKEAEVKRLRKETEDQQYKDLY